MGGGDSLPFLLIRLESSFRECAVAIAVQKGQMPLKNSRNGGLSRFHAPSLSATSVEFETRREGP